MPVSDPKLGFIGAGMMSSAMINGIIAAKVRAEDFGKSRDPCEELSLHAASCRIYELYDHLGRS